MTAFNVLDFCTVEKREDPAYVWYAVIPSTIYPATLARIQEVLSAGIALPDELIGSANLEVAPADGAKQLMRMAKAVPAIGWSLALRPRNEVTDKSQIEARAAALECARRWFTKALKLKVARPLGLRIVKDDAYRL